MGYMRKYVARCIFTQKRGLIPFLAGFKPVTLKIGSAPLCLLSYVGVCPHENTQV
jgi:hypothetical protein